MIKIRLPYSTVLVLLFATFALYRPAVNYGFLPFRDPAEVSENFHVLNGLRESAGWAFTDVSQGQWRPLTALSYMADAHFTARHPAGYHRTGVALHLLNVLLLFFLLTRLTGEVWPSAMTSALFALHPLQVEPVVWIAARSTLLGAFFGLSALALYCEAVKRPAVWNRALLPAGFLLAALSNPAWSVLPLLCLILDYWPLARAGAAGKGLLREKAPLLLAGLLFFFAALVIQSRANAGHGISLWMNAGRAPALYAAYLFKVFWPARLAVYYPDPLEAFPVWWPLTAASLLLAAAFAVFLAGRRWPWIITGWLWFFAALAPGVFLPSPAAPFLADHHAYIAVIGVFFAAAWSVNQAALYSPFRKIILAGVTAVLLPACFVAAVIQRDNWANAGTLFSHALNVTGENAVAHGQLGIYLLKEGEIAGAVRHLEEAARLNPVDASVRLELGKAYLLSGRPRAAVPELEKAITLAPGAAEALNTLADFYFKARDYGKAAALYERGLEDRPQDAGLQYNLALACLYQGEYERARDLYSRAVMSGYSPQPLFEDMLRRSTLTGEALHPEEGKKKPEPA